MSSENLTKPSVRAASQVGLSFHQGLPRRVLGWRAGEGGAQIALECYSPDKLFDQQKTGKGLFLPS
jgi:hypothetical protein